MPTCGRAGCKVADQKLSECNNCRGGMRRHVGGVTRDACRTLYMEHMRRGKTGMRILEAFAYGTCRGAIVCVAGARGSEQQS